MGVGRTIRELGDLLEAFDDEIGTVTSVELLGCGGPNAGSEAEVEVTVPPSAAHHQGQFAVEEPSIETDGRVRFALESTAPIVPEASPGFEIETTGATIDATGEVTVVLRIASGEPSIGTQNAEKNERAADSVTTAEDDPANADRERDVPPFRDPELLAAVYESCETFTEMSEEIEMDVTAETVRRYMIDYGIHEPNSYSTEDAREDEPPVQSGGSAEPETSETVDDRPEIATESDEEPNRSPPIALADGIGLPDDVTVESLVETVSRSNTVYEVTQDIGLGRDETLDLLRQLDLVEFVVGRVTTQHERRIDREEIVDRLRDASATRHG